MMIAFILSPVWQDSLSATSFSVELEGLYEPPPVAFSFEPVGWKILAALLLIGLLVIAYLQVRKYRRNRYRREALQELEQLHDPGSVPQMLVVLKRVAMQAFGREKVGSLYGKEWLQFLEKTGKNVRMLAYEQQIQGAVYRGEALSRESGHEILSNAKRWIKTHAGQL